MNVLFLWTDQQRPDTIGAYGNPRIRTPNLDRLAAESALFEHAYCAQPVCTPSRGTVLTGVYPHTHGAVRNNVPLREDVPTIAELLAPHGYHCGYAGKWHLGRELHAQRGFTWRSSTEDGYTADQAAEGYSTYHEWLVGLGYTPTSASKGGGVTFGRTTAARLPEAHGKPAFLAREARRFLEQHLSSRGRGAPFCLYVNFLEPHTPYTGPWDAMYEPDEMALPPTWYGDPDLGMPRRQRARRARYEGHNKHVARNDEWGWKETKARYWGLASVVDKYCGRILDSLEELGLTEETVVVFSTDHGDMMGEHRMVAKGVPFEGAVRVPLLLRVPGVVPHRVAAPTSQVDLVPTLLDALGVGPPEHVHGASLLPGLRERRGGASRREAGEARVVIEWNGARTTVNHGSAAAAAATAAIGGGDDEEDTEAASWRTIRDGRWKLTVDEDGEHELYDLRTDPDETRNLLYARRLGEAPGARAAVEDLWERLGAWRSRTRDSLVLPEPRPWGR